MSRIRPRGPSSNSRATIVKGLACLVLACSLQACASLSGVRDARGVVFFPEGVVHESEAEWYGSMLARMKEPSFADLARDPENVAVRFLVLSTWGRPVALRYSAIGNDIRRRAVMLSAEGEHVPGGIRAQKSIAMSRDDFQAVMVALEASGYWELASRDDISGRDGSTLVVESVRNGEYRLLTRWAPGYKSDSRGLTGLVDFHLAELEKSGLDMDIDD